MHARRRQVAAVKAELEAAVAAQHQQAQLGAAAAALEARTPSAVLHTVHSLAPRSFGTWYPVSSACELVVCQVPKLL